MISKGTNRSPVPSTEAFWCINNNFESQYNCVCCVSITEQLNKMRLNVEHF